MTPARPSRSPEDAAATLVPSWPEEQRRFAHLIDGPEYEGVEAAAVRPADATAMVDEGAA